MQVPHRARNVVDLLDAIASGRDAEAPDDITAEIGRRFQDYLTLVGWRPHSERSDEQLLQIFFPSSPVAEAAMRFVSDYLERTITSYAQLTTSNFLHNPDELIRTSDITRHLSVFAVSISMLDGTGWLHDLRKDNFIIYHSWHSALYEAVARGVVVCWRLGSDLRELFSIQEIRGENHVPVLANLLDRDREDRRPSSDEVDAWFVVIAQCLTRHRTELQQELGGIVSTFDQITEAYFSYHYAHELAFFQREQYVQRIVQLNELLQGKRDALEVPQSEFATPDEYERARAKSEALPTRLRRLFDLVAALLLRSYELPYVREIPLIPGGVGTQEAAARYKQGRSGYQ